jgi:phage-related protein
MSGVDDETIAAGENILLTFNKIGRKGGIFDRATKASLDLSVAFGKDMTSSSVLVGKALQDPVKGVSALSRVGVSFSKKQKDVIKRLVETGQTAKAQKLILKELETQVGGSAKAFGTTATGAVGKLKNRFDDISGQLVTMLLPAFEKLADKLEAGMKWFDGLSDGMKKNVGIGILLAAVLGPILVVVGSLITAFAAILPVLAGVTATGVAVGAALVALGAALIHLWRTNDGFRKGVTKAWVAIRKAIMETLKTLRKTISTWIGWAKAFWARWGDDIVRVTRRVWPLIRSVIGTNLQNIRRALQAVLALLGGDWRKAWSLMKESASASWALIGRVLGAAGRAAMALLKAAWSGIRGWFADRWASIRDTVVNGWSSISSALSGAGSRAVSTMKAAWSDVRGWFADRWASIRDTVSSGWASISSALSSAASNAMNSVTSAFSGLGSKLASIGRAAGSAMASAIKSAVNSVIGNWNSLRFSVDAIKIKGKTIFPGASVGTPDVPYLARGGTATRAGMAMVGEEGPELLHLPRGASVIPLRRGGSGQTINVYPQSQDVEAIARRVAFLLGSGRVPMRAGMA